MAQLSTLCARASCSSSTWSAVLDMTTASLGSESYLRTKTRSVARNAINQTCCLEQPGQRQEA